jgi:hypothetical protein
MHSNRTVIHPDYAGLGLGMMLINKTAEIMSIDGYRVMAKFSSTPVYKAMSKSEDWALKKVDRKVKTLIGGNMARHKGFREGVKTYSFAYVKGVGGDNSCDEPTS